MAVDSATNELLSGTGMALDDHEVSDGVYSARMADIIASDQPCLPQKWKRYQILASNRLSHIFTKKIKTRRNYSSRDSAESLIYSVPLPSFMHVDAYASLYHNVRLHGPF